VNELTQAQVNAWRLARHHLDRRAPKTKLADVVGDIGAVQAQVMSAAELQIAVRCDCSVRDVRDALWNKRSLVKTWLMRGTLHLARASDLPVFTAAMSKRWIHVNSAWLKFFNVTEAEVWALTDDIGRALDGTPKTREQVIDAVATGRSERIREAMKSGWGGMLKPAARNGRLCFGPNQGQSVTFVSPRTWLGGWREADPEAALTEMARRFVHTYGPATQQDFAYWWGNWSGVGVAAWAGLRGEIEPVAVDGRRAFVLRDDLERIHATTPQGTRVNLLPNFDPYLMGHANRDHLFARERRPKVSRTAGWISPVVLVDGRVVGVWAYILNKQRLRIAITPFARLARGVLSEARIRAEEIATSLDAKLDKLAVA
jgi:Winged helix DNA-binding domain